jgi:hypothetical protein
MTPTERDRAVAYLEQSRTALLSATEAFTEAQWRFKPSPEEWCPAECVEHIALVERMLLRRIQDGVSGPADPEEVLAAAAGKEDLILKMVPGRGRKVKAPEPARPSNRFADSASLLSFFTEIRENSIAYVRTTNDPIRTRTFPHFVFGPLDGYQWIIFMAAHTERHLNQLNEVKAGPEFPGYTSLSAEPRASGSR